VLRIGGIKQKTIGARQAGVDAFLVPVENSAEARRYADGLTIVPVASVTQAIRRLSKLQ
jgi:Lon-like protease